MKDTDQAFDDYVTDLKRKKDPNYIQLPRVNSEGMNIKEQPQAEPEAAAPNVLERLIEKLKSERGIKTGMEDQMEDFKRMIEDDEKRGR